MGLLKEGLYAGHWYHSPGPNVQVEEFFVLLGTVKMVVV